jgi:hypothetical protein
MKVFNSISEQAVWNHWRVVEHYSNTDFRKDIRGKLPKNMIWAKAEIEDKDLDKLFIISSDDWKDISAGTFSVNNVVKNIFTQSDNKDTQRISKNIQDKIKYITDGNKLDTALFLVSQTPNGPFTIIEGNKRSVVFSLMDTIVGCNAFLGVSPEINKYWWARYTFKNYTK